MCGIIGFKGNYINDNFEIAFDSIRHRGPDANGIFRHNDVVLGHHRLSILDLSEKGAQPYYFKNLVITYNGELYNFKTVRNELITKGYTFQSESDTEVLITAFYEWGPDCINKFVGMFAFAIYDKDDDSIYLFRDRMGVKPLYYSLDGGLCFGSELRTILPMIKNKPINHESVYEYFRLGYISENKSIYSNVYKLLPGHYAHYKNGELTLNKYWDIDQFAKRETNIYTDQEWKEILKDELIRAFSDRMLSDVPVGVFLSGGVDSSLVSAILQKHYGNIHTFTIGFNDDRYNEAPYAKQIASYIGSKHTEFTLDINDAEKILGNFYDIYDEPFADSSGIPSTIVSTLAAKAGVKVVLSANGGDELFAGYQHYQTTIDFYNKFRSIPRSIRSILTSGTQSLYNTGILKFFFLKNIEHRIGVINELLQVGNLISFYNSFLANQGYLEINALLRNHNKHTPINTAHIPNTMNGIMLYDMKHYLPDDLLVKMDRATMYNGIEGREPFIDHKVVELACKMPVSVKWRNGESKWILKELLADYIPREMFMRPKMGFSIPIFKWFSASMGDLFEYYITQDRLDATGIFNTNEVLHEFRKFKWNKERNKEYNIEKMWRILSFMMWWDKWRAPL